MIVPARTAASRTRFDLRQFRGVTGRSREPVAARAEGWRSGLAPRFPSVPKNLAISQTVCRRIGIVPTAASVGPQGPGNGRGASKIRGLVQGETKLLGLSDEADRLDAHARLPRRGADSR